MRKLAALLIVAGLVLTFAAPALAWHANVSTECGGYITIENPDESWNDDDYRFVVFVNNVPTIGQGSGNPMVLPGESWEMPYPPGDYFIQVQWVENFGTPGGQALDYKEYRVTLKACPTTTTTTVPETTTTLPPTTTTLPPTTTTVPETTTTVPQTTTTVSSCDETSPLWNPATQTCELPFTGVSSYALGLVAKIGIGMMIFGFMFMGWAIVAGGNAKRSS